jgi:hypothetical protein
MNKNTRTAVAAILAADGTITKADADAALKQLEGKADTPPPEARVIRTKDACRLIGVHKKTLRNWADAGLLVPCYGANPRQRIGYTADSVHAILEGRSRKQRTSVPPIINAILTGDLPPILNAKEELAKAEKDAKELERFFSDDENGITLDRNRYFIAWNRIQTKGRLLEWVLHLCGKEWMDTDKIAYFIVTVSRHFGWNPYAED